MNQTQLQPQRPPTSLTQREQDTGTIRALLTKYQPEFANALPSLLTPERFTRVALTCINKNPKLLTCTRESLLACLLDCAQLGIEPDGRRAHLIPYGTKCTLIIDYKGIAELVRRSGEISTLHCGIVYPADDFDYAFGTGQFLKHRPSIQPRGAAKPYCVYSYVKLKDGQEDFDVMGIEEVNLIRKRSKSPNDGPWVTDYDEMAKKTVFRRHSKWLPLSPELRDKLEKDDDALTEQERFAAAKPVSEVKFDEPPIPTPTAAAAADKPAPSPAEDRPKRGRGRPPKNAVEEQPSPAAEPQPEPPRATPLEGLRNLMKGNKIEEGPLLAYLFGNLAVEQGDRLDTLPEGKIQYFIEQWPVIIEGMQKEAAGPFA